MLYVNRGGLNKLNHLENTWGFRIAIWSSYLQTVENDLPAAKVVIDEIVEKIIFKCGK